MISIRSHLGTSRKWETMAFFTPWQTWVKLTFVSVSLYYVRIVLTLDGSQVLGCAIVSQPIPAKHAYADGCGQCVVLTYGIGVRYLNKRRLKKHTIRIATEIAERGEMTEAVRRSEEVPFGIRAIERGCMVEGVWNSKASTPLQTPASSKANSPILKGKNTLNKHNRDSSLSNVSDVDIPEPASVTNQSRERGAGLLHVPLENLRNTSRNQIAAGMLDVKREMPTRGDLADGPGPAISRDQTITVTTYDLPPFGSGSQPGPSVISNGTLHLRC